MIPPDILEIDQSAQPETHGYMEELVAVAIAGIIGAAKADGRTLQDLTEEVLFDDQVLDQATRNWLSDVVVQAWNLPIHIDSQPKVA